jgi:predicted glycosyltransferase involved in capsule biosynthesis
VTSSNLKSSGENENFRGWGPEDVERVKRMEILNYKVHFADGPMFHLWHPKGKTSWYIDKSAEIQNRREFIETCKNGMFKAV